MSHSEAFQLPYHDAPEVCDEKLAPIQILDSEAPGVPCHEAPERYYEAPEAIQPTLSIHDSGPSKDSVQQRKATILGLSPVLFLTLLLLILLVIGGAIGGGVGGSAAQRRRSGSRCFQRLLTTFVSVANA